MEELTLFGVILGDYEQIIDGTRMCAVKDIINAYNNDYEKNVEWKAIAKSEDFRKHMSDTYHGDFDFAALYDENYKFIEFVNVKYIPRVIGFLDKDAGMEAYQTLLEGQYTVNLDYERKTPDIPVETLDKIAKEFDVIRASKNRRTFDTYFADTNAIYREAGTEPIDHKLWLREIHMRHSLEQCGDWGKQEDDYEYEPVPMIIIHSRQKDVVQWRIFEMMF